MNEKKMKELKAILIIMCCVLWMSLSLASIKVKIDEHKFNTMKVLQQSSVFYVKDFYGSFKGVFYAPYEQSSITKMEEYITRGMIAPLLCIFFYFLSPFLAIRLIIKQFKKLKILKNSNEIAEDKISFFERMDLLNYKTTGFIGRSNAILDSSNLDKKDKFKWRLGWAFAFMIVMIVASVVLFQVPPAIAVFLSWVCILLFVITLWLNPWAALLLSTIFLIMTYRSHGRIENNK